MDVLLGRFGVSERRACRVVGQHRSTQRLIPPEIPAEDEILTNWLKEFSIAHPRWGYKRAYALARDEGWIVNRKRVQRLWRAAGLKVPYRKRKKPYLGAASGMGVHQPLGENVIWALDFQFDQTKDTRVIKILNIIDEYSREALASMAKRSINAAEVVAVLDGLLAERGKPCFIRCDNGPEFIADVVASWACEVGTQMYFIAPGSPWLNGRVESFNARLRDELLNGELFESIAEAQILLDRWRHEYNHRRPHSSLGYLSPKTFLALPMDQQRAILTRSSRLHHWKGERYKQAA